MGALRAGTLQTVGQSTAQRIDGGLRFDSGKSQHLTRTPSSAGNRRTWTWSGWLKRAGSSATNKHPFYGAYGGSSETSTLLGFDNSTADVIRFEDDFINGDLGGKTPAVFRDFGGGWYHVVISLDTTQSSVADGLKIYVNGTQQTGLTGTLWNQNHESNINSTVAQYLGSDTTAANRFYDGSMSQVYFIDGQALGPGYFGYTDPLTNTWRPKKFVSSYATSPNDINTTWSDSLTASSGFNSSYPALNAFDGSLTTFASGSGGSQSLTLSSSFTNVTSLRIKCADSAGGFSMGGETYTISGTGITTKVISSDAEATNLTSITLSSTTISGITVTSSSGLQPRISAIEINGVILVNNAGWGKNGFHLPFDGSAPIGQDRSGRGNDWTPVNFGGSMELPKATGAFPILNTDGGGKVARVDVRTDAYADNLVLALPLVGNKEDVSAIVKGSGSNKTVTVTSATASSAQSNFYGGSYLLGNGKYLDVTGISVSENQDYTIEFWVKLVSASSYAMIHSGSGNWGNLEFYWSIQSANSSDGRTVLNRWRVEDGAGGMNSNNVKTDYDESASVATSWNHIAFVRSSGNCYLYYNGRRQTLHGATTDTSAKSGTLRIGHTTHGEYYLSDYRFYVGVAKYTSNFIPASTDPDILPDTPSGVSYSSNVALVPSTDGAVAFDGSGDYLQLAYNTDFNFGSGDFTIAGFVNINTLGTKKVIANYIAPTATTGNDLGWIFGINTSNQLEGVLYNGTSAVGLIQGGTLTTGKWYHVAYVRSGTNFYMFIDGQSVGTATGSSSHNVNTGWNISIGYGHSSDTQYMNGFISNLHIVKGTALYTSNFTPPSAPISSVANTKLLCCKSNSTPLSTEISPGLIGPPVTASGDAAASTTNPFSSETAGSISLDGTGDYLQASGSFWSAHSPATFEAWIYCTDISYVDGTQIFETGGQGDFCILSNGALRVHPAAGNAHDTPSSTISENTWYHVALVQTATTRKIFVNGVEQTLTSALGNGLTTNWNNPTGNPGFGKAGTYRADFPGYMSNIRISDYEVYASNFTSRTTPFDTLTEANNLLTAFSRTSSTASAGTNAKATNFNPFTTDINAVRGQESGYCTLNPLHANNVVINGYSTLSNGNLTASAASNGNDETSGTIGVSSGKWYFELINESGGNNTDGVGIADLSSGIEAICRDNGEFRYNGSQSSYGSSWQTIGDVIGVKVDLDNSTIGFYKNGVYQGDAKTDLPAVTYHPFVYNRAGAPAASTLTLNFGQKPFKYAPPEGFQPLTLANLQRPTIVRPDQYVGIVTYTGNAGTQSLNVGFKPDFLWFKSRSSAYSGTIYDSVRGAYKSLATIVTNAEGTNSSGMSSFDDAGFSLNGENDVLGSTNVNTVTYVTWAWKAGGNSNTFNIDDVGYATASAAGLTGESGVTLTGASIGTKQGFSIVSYLSTASDTGTGQIPHGLSQTPDFVIIKNRDWAASSQGWPAWHSAVPNQSRYLDSTNAWDATEFSYVFNNTAPTSSVVNVSSNGSVSAANRYRSYGGSDNFIMYSWHSVPGLQKFGSYTGNGLADGPVVITGFRPKWIMLKETGNANPWFMFDTERSKINPTAHTLWANYNYVENSTTINPDTTYNNMDILSNGFKLRSSYSGTNRGGGTYIYAAFAEAPTFNLYGAQSNAR